ncbi:MAG: GyrI-like domain-containing protein [Candidatus Aminicenantales bacterium]
MKATRGILWAALMAAGLTLTAAPISSPAMAAGMAPRQSLEPFGSIKEVKPFTYCVIDHKGPLTGVSDVITQLMQAVQVQNLFPLVRGPMVGVYYNSPAQVKPEELLWEVGFPVTEQAAPKAPLEKKTWNYKTVAEALHSGPYAKAGETIQRLMTWIGANGYVVDGPVLERYMNNPMQVKPEELRTEIWIPVRKK